MWLFPTINENKSALDLLSYIPGESPMSKLSGIACSVRLYPCTTSHELTSLPRYPLALPAAEQRGDPLRHHYCLTGSIITGMKQMVCEYFRLKQGWISKKGPIKRPDYMIWLKGVSFQPNTPYKSWKTWWLDSLIEFCLLNRMKRSWTLQAWKDWGRHENTLDNWRASDVLNLRPPE